MDGEDVPASVRFRTVGDMSCTGAVASDAATLEQVVAEIAATRVTERETRADDRARGGDGGQEARWLLLRQLLATELVRLVTAGSVDDGKSTLIGRLLYDTKQILADQLEHIEQTSKRRGDGYVNLALLTDGLRAEREQDHDRRRLPLVRDAAPPLPARRRARHVQYTRNMVTGASTADVAIILVDARKGVIEQTRRHSFIAAILGTRTSSSRSTRWTWPTSPRRFREIEQELRETSERLGLRDVQVIPMSALRGDNVVERGAGRCPGTTGRRCSSTSRPSRSPATATSTTAASPSSG